MPTVTDEEAATPKPQAAVVAAGCTADGTRRNRRTTRAIAQPVVLVGFAGDRALHSCLRSSSAACVLLVGALLRSGLRTGRISVAQFVPPHGGFRDGNDAVSIHAAGSQSLRSEILDRLPPQSIEAEKAVLGSMLLDPDVCDDVALLVRAAGLLRARPSDPVPPPAGDARGRRCASTSRCWSSG